MHRFLFLRERNPDRGAFGGKSSKCQKFVFLPLFVCLKTLQKYIKNNYEILYVVFVAKNVVKRSYFGENNYIGVKI